MRLSPAAFNAFLGGAVRQDVKWRRATACPCVQRDSGHAKPNCPACGGRAWVWGAAKAAWAGIQGMSPRTAQAMFGAWEEGDATITIPAASPLYNAGRYDRIQMGDATAPFSSVIVPGLVERLDGNIAVVESVVWLEGDKLVEGPAPEVDGLGNLKWSGARPPAGKSFTVTGRRWVELYLFNDVPNSRNSGISGLPRKVTARRFDLLGRSGSGDLA